MNSEKLEKMKSLFKDCTIVLTSRSEFQFAGMVFYSLKRTLCDSEDYKKLNKEMANCSLAYTDGKQIVYLITEDTKRGDFIFITLHEILHIASDHLARRNDRNGLIWNLACDHIVNGVCKSYKDAFPTAIDIPDGIFHLHDLDLTFQNSTVEDVYEHLMKEMQSNKIKTKTIKIRINGAGSGDFEPSDGEEPSDEDCETIDVNIVERDGKKYVVANDTDIDRLAKNLSKESGKDEESIKRELKDLMGDLQQNIKSNWYSMKQAGNLPGDFVEYIDKMFDVKMPWDTVLEDAILYPVQCYQRKSWNTINPILKGIPAYRRTTGQYSYRAKGRHPKDLFPFTLIFSIDSSGSISVEDLTKAVNVISQAYNKYKDIIVLVHDHTVQDEIHFKDISSKEAIIDSFKKNGIKGRGGTSHKDLFARIDELSEDHNISSIIFMTDFYSDIDSVYNDYKFIKENETIWLIVDNPKLKEVHLDDCKTRTLHI